MLRQKEIQKIIQLIENRVESKFALFDQQIQKLEHEIADLKENSEITRSSVNALLEWADDASIQTVRLLDRKSK